MPKEINWLKMETQIRMVLEDKDMSSADKVLCIDEIIAKFTRRGNEIPVFEKEYQRLANQFPTPFDWEDV